MKRFFRMAVIALLLAAICKCSYELWNISKQYSNEARIKDELSGYRPGAPMAAGPAQQKGKAQNAGGKAGGLPTGGGVSSVPPARGGGEALALGSGQDNGGLAFGSGQDNGGLALGSGQDREALALGSGQDREALAPPPYNQSIADLETEVNEDALGWLSIPNTHIDYPVVIGGDNDYYLRRDIHKNEAYAGSIFMDYRCDRGFAGANTIIYGHNMKNRSMFGDLREFADEWFFENNPAGTLYLKDATYTLNFFAYMIVDAGDSVVFDPSAGRDKLYEYAEKNAVNFSPPDPDGKIVTLSTCSYEFTDARMVLLANIAFS